MSGTMTWVGLDVHARSTHAAVIDLATGELSRMRFGAGVEAPVAWLQELGAGAGVLRGGPDRVRALPGGGRRRDRDAGRGAGEDSAWSLGSGED